MTLRLGSAARFLPALAFLTTACLAVERPEPELDIEPPPAWTAADADAAVLDDWLGTFNDAPLEALVAEALAHNHDLGAALARLEAASSQARIAGADLSPQVGVGLQGQRSKQLFVGLPIPGAGDTPPGATFNNFGVSLDLSWELDLWGKLRARRSAGAADLAAAAFDLSGAQLSLAAQTAKAWFALAEAHMQHQLQLATVENYRSSFRIVDERYRAGIRSALDLRLGQAQLSESQAGLEQRARQLDSAKRQLELLLGRYPAGELAALAALPDVPPPVPAGLPSELLARRPDLLAAEERFRAAGLRVHEARAALLPSFSLTGSLGRVSDEIEDLIDTDFSVWSIASGLLQPIFQGGRLAANADLSEARMRELLEGYRGAALRAFLEVESALAGEGFLEREEDRLASASAESVAAQGIAEEQYRAGLVDVITLLDAQRRALGSESARINARRRRLEARIDLHLALGGGFEVTVDPNSVAPVPATGDAGVSGP